METRRNMRKYKGRLLNYLLNSLKFMIAIAFLKNMKSEKFLPKLLSKVKFHNIATNCIAIVYLSKFGFLINIS